MDIEKLTAWQMEQERVEALYEELKRDIEGPLIASLGSRITPKTLRSNAEALRRRALRTANCRCRKADPKEIVGDKVIRWGDAVVLTFESRGRSGGRGG